MTGSNVINVLRGGGALGAVTPPRPREPKLFCWSQVTEGPFCVITQHRKFEFGHHHHRRSKKISNAQELTMQLSQTLSSAIAQIQKMHKTAGEKFVDFLQSGDQ